MFCNVLKFVSDGKQQMIIIDQKNYQNLLISNQASIARVAEDSIHQKQALSTILSLLKKHLQFRS